MNQTNSNLEKSPKPLKTESQINQVRAYLNDRPRDLLLFELSIQTGIAMKKLLSLKVSDLAGTGVGDRISIGSDKGVAPHFFIVTQSLYRAWEAYLKQMAPSENGYLFKSRKGVNPLNLSTVSNMVNEWFTLLDFPDMSGIRSLKKTWECHYRNNIKSAFFISGSSDTVEVLQPLKIATAQEIVYDQLIDAIIAGRFFPGERLKIKDIASQMQVSRVPVREAFLRLQAGGFISPVKKSAAVVMELSRNNLKEILEIRLAIESMAAKKAAIRCSDQTLQHLESLQAEYEKRIRSHDVEKTLKANKQFHFTIYREAEMPIMLEIIESLWNRINPYLNILLRVMSEAGHPLNQESCEYHMAILNAMRHRDPAEADRWLHVDLTKSYSIIHGFFDKIKQR